MADLKVGDFSVGEDEKDVVVVAVGLSLCQGAHERNHLDRSPTFPLPDKAVRKAQLV